MAIVKKIISLIKEVFCDRRLLWDLSRKDVKRRFSGTYFGMVWGLLQPLLTIIVYWAAFQFGFRSGDVGKVPFGLWFISGIILWLFVQEAISMSSNCFIEYNYLIQKVKFNVTILPLVKILSSYFIHLFFVAIVILICSIMGYSPKLMIIQLIYYMIATMCFLFSLSLISASLMIFFRDLGQIINVFLLIGMWATPIAWDMSNFNENVQKILKLNVFYYLVEGYRDSILSRGWFWERPVLSLYYWLVTFILFLIGAFLFVRLRPHFADSV